MMHSAMKAAGAGLPTWGNVLALLLSFSVLSSCSGSHEPLQVVAAVDLERYAGNWYELYRLPNRFEKDLICVQAQYSIQENGSILVVNSGLDQSKSNELKEITGSARVPDPNDPARLKVTFFWPFAGDYQIIALDTLAYQYALVGDPSRKFLWILCRDKALDDVTVSALKSEAARQGFPVEALQPTPQDCPERKRSDS